MSLRQRIASLVRRSPRLMVIAYYLYRFIQPKYSVGVAGVVLNDAQEILLVEHVFHPRLPWGLPGGWVDWNEEPASAIVREMQEELNLDVEIERVLLVNRTKFNHVDIAYLCQTESAVGDLSYELLGYAWVAFADLPPMHSFQYQAIQAAMTHPNDKE